MRIALFGGTGYVGSYLVDALIRAGMRPVLLVRRGSEARVRYAGACDIISGDIDDDAAIARVVEGADGVIYNIGILREFPDRGVTFEALHDSAAYRTIEAAQRAGVKRFILMSANGVASEGTPYQRSKLAAERFLATTDLDWTIFRPSVIFGDPRGHMEFATQLARDIVASPLPAPLFFAGLRVQDAGQFALSPVHVEDVARAFVTALETPEAIHQTFALGGPRTLSWRAIISTIAAAMGRQKLMLPVPALGVAAAATLLDRFEQFPITRDQLQMLLQGNTCGDGAFSVLEIDPKPFDVAQLQYLAPPNKEPQPCHQNAA